MIPCINHFWIIFGLNQIKDIISSMHILMIPMPVMAVFLLDIGMTVI